MINSTLMTNLLKLAASQVDIDIYQRLMAYSILKKAFKDIESARVFKTKQDLWRECITNQVGISNKIAYAEFGVYKGYSINFFAQHNLNNESIFIGLDSFEGLPESWGPVAKGTFSTKGIIPKTNDSRVSFIKGLFQNTFDDLFARLLKAETLVIHYDADLYSSTLFALAKIDNLKKSYIAIFDEFTGHETRALYNYIQVYNASVSFIGKTIDNGYPSQVMCKIVPNIIRKPTPPQL
jgi:hypothetical protein